MVLLFFGCQSYQMDKNSIRALSEKQVSVIKIIVELEERLASLELKLKAVEETIDDNNEELATQVKRVDELSQVVGI